MGGGVKWFCEGGIKNLVLKREDGGGGQKLFDVFMDNF